MNPYITEGFKQVQDIIKKSEDRKLKYQNRLNDINNIIEGLYQEYETELLLDEKKADAISKNIKTLEAEKVEVEQKTRVYNNDKMDVLLKNDDFSKLAEQIKENNLKKIDELQEQYSQNNVKLVQLRNDFYKLVIEQGEIKRHSKYLAGEIMNIKPKDDNRFYSGIVDSQNLVRKEGTIYLNEVKTESLYRNIDNKLDQEEKELLKNVIDAYKDKIQC